ncbi:MAG: hypothetical protein OHK0046_51090 [Anaerolineae bacterium]
MAAIDTSPVTPWYRDIRIIRAVAQIVFAFVFVGSIVVLFTNLVRNLEQSNLSLNFEIYKAPFTVALSEGPSVTEDWAWLQSTQTITNVVWVIWFILLGLFVYLAFGHVRKIPAILHSIRHRPVVVTTPVGTLVTEGGARLPPRHLGEINWVGLGIAVAGVLFLLLLLLVAPPSEVPQFLNDYFYGGSMARAFVTGVANTLSVVFFSLIACTILGIVVGIGLLSSNFLVRGVSAVFVEIFRNTPLLVQLLFIYRTLTLLLPRPRDSIFSSNVIGVPAEQELFIFNARGFYFALPNTTAGFPVFLGFILLAIFAALALQRWRKGLQDRTGQPARSARYALPAFFGIVVLGWLISGGLNGPFTPNYPALAGLNVQGGSQLTIGFTALFLGLTFYTGAFIAEIVRAGIQSVPYGQIEAARSQGFRGSQVLGLVVLPQALRLIIPPLGNQYVNLGKNSSLGLAVNYADTYRVAQLANNESGQAVPFFVGLMVLYLTLSLTLSVMTNLVNRATRTRTR